MGDSGQFIRHPSPSFLFPPALLERPLCHQREGGVERGGRCLVQPHPAAPQNVLEATANPTDIDVIV